MTTRRGRNAGPVQDNRLVQRPEDDTVWKSPFSRNLGYSSGLAHYSGDMPLKQDLNTATDYSRRESSRPVGDLYADMQNMISNSISNLPVSGSISAGTGLVKTGDTFSVSPDLSIVTKVGTLTGLTVDGPAVFNDTVSVPAPTDPSDAATKLYVDSSSISAGTGLTKTGNTLAVNATQTGITSLGTLTGLTVDGPATFTNSVSVPTAVDPSDACNKSYVDGTVVLAGAGLTKTGNTLALDSTSITSVGTLTGLTVEGASSFSVSPTIPAPTAGEQATNRDYVDGTVVTAGAGLTKTGNVLAVDGAAITAVGTLTGLTVAGNATIDGTLSVTKAISTPVQYFAPADGDTVTSTASSAGVILNPGGPLAALTVVFPATPLNGQRFLITSSQDVTALTASATFANANAPAAITAGVPLNFIYNGDATAWFRA